MTKQDALKHIDNKRKAIMTNAGNHMIEHKCRLSLFTDPIDFYDYIEEIYTEYVTFMHESLDNLDTQERILTEIN